MCIEYYPVLVVFVSFCESMCGYMGDKHEIMVNVSGSVGCG